MEKTKRKGDKLKGMDYWKMWCGQAVSNKEEHLATEPTTSLHAANETAMRNEPSTSVTESKVEIEAVELAATCFMPTTTEPTFSLDQARLSGTSCSVAKLDVGFYSNKAKIVDDYLKFQILKKPWTPSKDYEFPISTKRNLRFQLK